MRKALLVAAFLLLPATAHAQQWLQFSSCGTPPRTLIPGTAATIGVDLNGSLCINGSISVAITPPTVNNPWVTNVSQFGGANVVTGTGLSGAGIPRVTVSSDSTVNIGGQPIAVSGSFATTVTSATITNTVNNPVVDNIAQFGGANVVTGTGPSGAGIPRVTMSNDSSISITPPTVNNPWVDNIAQFGGSNVVTGTGTGGAGIPRVTISSDSTVGITGTPTVTFTNITLAATPINVSIAPAQVASGAYLDGAITAEGSRGDTAYGGSGSSTIIGILKGLYSILTGSPNRTITNTVNNPIPENVSQFGGSNVVTGTGTSGAGIPRVTISNDSSVSLNATPLNIAIAPAQVASGAYVDGAINTIGAQADAAWSSGNGTLIAIAKKIANNTGGSGTNVTVANTVNNPVVDNIAQFGGSNVVTGTGVGGAGIPRVTVSSDSSVAVSSVSGTVTVTEGAVTIANTVNNPVPNNVSQFGGSNVVTGTGNSGAGIPRVTIASDSGIAITSFVVTPLNIAIAPSQVASGAFLDGSITAIGSRLDTAWVSGAGTVIAVLKAVATSVGNLYSFFSNGSNLIGTVSPAASPWGLNTTGTAPIATTHQISAVATSSEPTKYTANQVQIPVMDLAAKLIVSPYAGRENFISGTVSASTTGVKAVIASPTNTTFSNYITDFNCTRNDAGTTAITVTTNETTTDGVQGASGWTIPNTGGGGGFMKHFSVPIKVAAGKAFQIQILTAVTSVMCTAQGYLGY